MVKSDAYGHGISLITSLLKETKKVDYIGVALVEEAELISKETGDIPILVHTPSYGEDLNQLPLSYEYVINSLKTLSKFVETGSIFNVHLKIDTGMNRLGIDQSELKTALEIIKKSSLNLKGLLSHLVEEGMNNERSIIQKEKFEKCLTLTSEHGFEPEILHLCNSAGALTGFSKKSNLARIGLALYGYGNSEYLNELSPVMKVFAEIIQIKKVRKGETTSYGAEWTFQSASYIATLAIGYGDGIPFSYFKQGYVIIAGQKCKIVGRICMDLMMVDLSPLENDLPKEGDLAMIIGQDTTEKISAADIAESTGTIVYEILTNFSKRLPKRLGN